MPSSLREVRLVALPRFAREDGELVAIESHSDGAPFSIARVFTIRAPENSIRGKHAHRRCTQLMIGGHGKIVVECNDGASSQSFTLDRIDQGLLVPPGIWAEVTFLVSDSMLLVLCDRPFEEADYIRDLSEFRAWRSESDKSKNGGGA